MRIGKAWWAVAVVAALAGLATAFPSDPACPVPPAREAELFPFVRAMTGTRPDGGARADGGELAVDAELRLLFDYYLAAIGNRTVEAIELELGHELDQRLTPPLALQARRLLSRYLDYRRALVKVERDSAQAGLSTQAIRTRMELVRRLREEFFTETEAQGLFGVDDAYARDVVSRVDIMQDPALNEAQKKAKMSELDRNLPAEWRAAREAPLRLLKLQEASLQMRAQGAGEDEIYRMRAAALDPAAAGRLAELDKEEAAWRERIAAYVAKRRSLLLGGGAAAERDAAMRQLRESMFSPQEQMRLPAYE